ncbi:hypothetical protein N9B72_00830 [Bacteriovoracaceae bacterium]|nr:hypothetical protein [Bacteriovoracaceae bacterium]
MIKLVLLSLLTFSSITLADILFVDFNRSMSEVKAAKEAAKIRGEKLITIPKYTSEQISTVTANQYQITKIQTKINNLYKKEYNDVNKAKINQLYKDQQKYHDRIGESIGALKFELSDIDARVKQLNKNGTKITSVVLSGHSNGDRIWGDNATHASYSRIIDTFQKYPDTFEEFNSVFTAACYSMTPEKAHMWSKNFDSLSMCYGYSKSGPGHSTSAAPSTIKDGLIDESNIIKANSAQKVKSQLLGIENARYTTAALYLPSCGYYSDMSGVNEHMSVLVGDCDLSIKRIDPEYSTLKKVYLNYKNAVAGHEDPSIDNGHTKIRAFYNLYQQLPGECQTKENLPGYDKVLALIKYDHIKENYDIFYGAAKKKLDVFSDWAGMKSSMKMPVAKDMTRAELKNYLKNFDKDLAKWKSTSTSTKYPITMKLHALIKANPKYTLADAKKKYWSLIHKRNRIENLLINFNCLPITTWIEGNMTNKDLKGPTTGCK